MLSLRCPLDICMEVLSGYMSLKLGTVSGMKIQI